MESINLNKIKIEEASIKNSREILNLLNSSDNLVGYSGEKFTINEVKSYIQAKINLVLVSKIKNKVTGVLIAHLWKDYCYLYLFIVDKNYRNIGIGNCMLDFLEKKSKREGYIGLITKEDDKEMINLLKKRRYMKGDRFVYFYKNLK